MSRLSILGEQFNRPTGAVRMSDPGLVLAALLAAFVAFPLLQPGLPATADTPIHFYRTLELGRSWAPGVLFPRWAPDFAFGYGLPFWVFTPPLPYLAALAIQALGVPLTASLKVLWVATAVAYPVGAYLLVRDLYGPASGLVAAAVFGLSTFVLRETLLYGGNLPQAMAVGTFPWLLWAVGRAVRCGGRSNVRLTAAFFAAILLCHQFHALLIAPVAVGFALVLWFSRRSGGSHLGSAAAGIGLGLALSCFFWLPALVERQWTGATEASYMDINPFYSHFLSLRELTTWPQPLDRNAANPWLPLTLQPPALLLAGAGVFVLFLRRRNIPSLVTGAFWIAVLVGSCFLVLPPSAPLWFRLPFLAMAQFPWRVLGVTTLALSVLAGAAVSFWSPNHNRGPGDRSRAETWFPHMLAAVMSVTILLSVAAFLYPFLPFIRYGPTITDMARYEAESRNVGMTTLGEYVPKWVETMPRESRATGDLAGKPHDRLDRDSLPAGTTADLLESFSNRLAYQIDASEPFKARFHLFFFPGWSASADGEPLVTEPEPGTGLVSVELPAGAHVVQLAFRETPLRSASNAVSVVTLLAVALLSLLGSGAAAPSALGLAEAEKVWPVRAAAVVGTGMVLLLLAKILVVDPHTDWFRLRSPQGQVTGTGHPLAVDFGDSFRLLGYDVCCDSVSQGRSVQVVLYWSRIPGSAHDGTNYRTFVHLDSPVDQRTWAGADHAHPGDPITQIELPTSTWDTTRYVRDAFAIEVPSRVPPVALSLRAGIYDPDTGRRLPIRGRGDDTLTLQTLLITTGRGLTAREIPHQRSFSLGRDVVLAGYGWNAETSELTLYWRCRSPMASPAVVFVHLIDAGGNLVWGADTPPLSGLFPTTEWQANSIVADPRTVDVAGLSPGAYTVSVGMYDQNSGQRLTVADAEGRAVPSDSVPLFQVSVE